MSLVKIAGDMILKGGKYIIRHPEKVEKAVFAAGRIVHTVMELKEKLLNPQTKAEYFIQLEEANNTLHDQVIEIESKVYELAEYYDKELVALEKKNEELVSEVDTLKNELQAYKEENNVYKKKIQKILLLAGVLMSIGIISAIILAIFA